MTDIERRVSEARQRASEPYENTLTIEQLRAEVRHAWDQSLAFNMALIDLPNVPSVDALRAISHAAMNTHNPRVLHIGKAMQRRLGLDAIPPKTERECEAGLWSIIRAAILAARER